MIYYLGVCYHASVKSILNIIQTGTIKIINTYLPSVCVAIVLYVTHKVGRVFFILPIATTLGPAKDSRLNVL